MGFGLIMVSVWTLQVAKAMYFSPMVPRYVLLVTQNNILFMTQQLKIAPVKEDFNRTIRSELIWNVNTFVEMESCRYNSKSVMTKIFKLKMVVIIFVRFKQILCVRLMTPVNVFCTLILASFPLIMSLEYLVRIKEYFASRLSHYTKVSKNWIGQS